MRYQDMDPLDVVFSLVDDKTGKTTHINVTALAKSWKTKARPIVTIEVEPAIAEYFVQKRGIEQHRVDRLMGEEIKEPLLLLHWIDGSHLLVDGHHRYVAASLKGQTELKARLVPKSVWSKYVIVDLPAERSDRMTKGFSGIL
ncbi:MAG: hypothetical protein M9945_14430 [Aquamicrobium sp.]|uniref:hypothetical protein n=1 Tax=Aquamicrobium sp. TaxID=1872579 RepID=UPI00349EE238|nr:hypothetical protein [Aquamicrobium sp.]